MIARSVQSSLVILLLSACSPAAQRPSRASASPPATPADRTGDPGRIVFLGTSLTAGLGLDPEQAYPALIQQKLDSAGLPYVAVNAGVSGETSAGARRRIDWILKQPVAVLVIETGANDGLRGLDVDSLRANIEAVIARANQQRPRPHILLVQMRALPNYGVAYTRRFEAVYRDIARQYGIPLIPFPLEGFAGVDSLIQADGLHPTAAGQRQMTERIWRALRPELQGAVSSKQ
jgi:acyl-CoA thioesterase-1